MGRDRFALRSPIRPLFNSWKLYGSKRAKTGAYFVRKNEGRKGFASEMANAFTHYGFEKLGLKRLEIRTCPQNEATCKVPRKLGYQFLTVFEKNKVSTQGTLWDLEIHVRFDTEGLPELSVKYS